MTEALRGEVGERGAENGGRIVAYPPTAVLTAEEVAAWLQVGEATVYRLPIRRIQVGERTTRYLAKDVYDFLEGRAA